MCVCIMEGYKVADQNKLTYFCETQKGLRKALIVQKGYEAKLKIISNVADER